LKEWIAGIQKQDQEQKRDAPVSDDGSREGHNITNGYQLGDTIIKE
jgi:hypothetical protein